MLLNKYLKCIESGLLIAEIKGKDIIPTNSIGAIKMLIGENVESADVDYDTAIAYLKKEAISLPENKRGYVLIKYKKSAFGLG